MENKMDTETFDKIQAFEKKYAEILIEWLTLVKNKNNNHAWQPKSWKDSYGVALYENSIKHGNKLSEFEADTHKDILLTYLKYRPDCRNYPYTFNYKEPSTDLALNPVPSDMIHK